MTKSERFEYLQNRWQEADEVWHAYMSDLARQYQSHWNAPAGKRNRLERMGAAESRACERFICLLENLNPARRWRVGFPVGWLMSSLTFADAITRERMHETPPPAYGYNQHDAEVFASACREEN